MQLGFALRRPEEVVFTEQTLFMEFLDHVEVSAIDEPLHKYLGVAPLVANLTQRGAAIL